MMPGDAIVDRARTMLGRNFRFQGRGDAGLDCVGLIGAAYDRPVPTGYRLRTGDPAIVAMAAVAAGLQAVDGIGPGDLLVMTSGPGQLHLGIATGDGFIHADAGLGRVVERPGAPPWPVVAVWRQEGGN